MSRLARPFSFASAAHRLAEDGRRRGALGRRLGTPPGGHAGKLQSAQSAGQHHHSQGLGVGLHPLSCQTTVSHSRFSVGRTKTAQKKQKSIHILSRLDLTKEMMTVNSVIGAINLVDSQGRTGVSLENSSLLTLFLRPRASAKPTASFSSARHALGAATGV